MRIQNLETDHLQDFTLVGFYGGPLHPHVPSDSRDTCDATFTPSSSDCITPDSCTIVQNVYPT